MYVDGKCVVFSYKQFVMANVIIAGMHRSGTSLVTQWLNKCGLNVGHYCLGASPSNQDGHFEDIEFIRLHEDLLRDNDLPETGLTDKKVRNFSAYNQRRLEYLFQLKDDFYDQWAMKDPRSCMFLPFYNSQFPESNYLFIIRDYRSVVSSLLHREFKQIDKKYLSRRFFSRFIWTNFRRSRRLKKFYQENASKFLKIWIAYNKQIIDSLSTLNSSKYLIIQYSILKNCDSQIFNYLCHTWKLDLNFIPFKDIYKKELISPVIYVDDYITDEALLTQAKELERDLQVKAILQDLNIYVYQ